MNEPSDGRVWLQEIFLHASVYCGFPAAVDAFRTAAEVVDAATAAA